MPALKQTLAAKNEPYQAVTVVRARDGLVPRKPPSCQFSTRERDKRLRTSVLSPARSIVVSTVARRKHRPHGEELFVRARSTSRDRWRSGHGILLSRQAPRTRRARSRLPLITKGQQ